MKIRKDFREESRKNYGVTVELGLGLSLEQLQTGALCRIADALEKMAADQNSLLRDRDVQAERAKYAHKLLAKAERSNRALRGYLKRMKGKAAP